MACFNRDDWAMRPELLEALVPRRGRVSARSLCEGAMGLVDGLGATEIGSTAELAERLGWPVVLAVDAAGQGASVTALLEGFSRHRTTVRVAGVIFNRVGRARHGAVLGEAARAMLPELAILGTVPRDPALSLPERHLGLVQAGEHGDLEGFLERAARVVGTACDLEALVALARPARLAEPSAKVAPLPPLGQRIAVARDVASGFAYRAVLEGLREAGAPLAGLSPPPDDTPGEDADAVYLPGGHPELHAGQLAANRRVLEGRSAAP